ncbi:MAG: hypothetical protein EZS28_051975, partial [Streblomastix strix]
TESSLTKTKIGAGSDEYEKVNLYNLMGYDGADTLAIPLYYVYPEIPPIVASIVPPDQDIESSVVVLISVPAVNQIFPSSSIYRIDLISVTVPDSVSEFEI